MIIWTQQWLLRSSTGSAMHVFDLHNSDFIGKAQFEKVYRTKLDKVSIKIILPSTMPKPPQFYQPGRANQAKAGQANHSLTVHVVR